MAAATHTGSQRHTVRHREDVDLHGCYIDNKKNPDDPQCVPVDQLYEKHLPSRYQSVHLVDYILAYASLVVSVAINCVSEARPEKSPGSDKLYPCHNRRGSNVKREGTGYISEVHEFPDSHIPEYVTCECPDCLDSSTPKTQFAHVAIRTATHLVFDDKEANKVTCKIFMDKDSIELSGMRRVVNSIHCDYCLMIYVTHNMDLVNRIKKLVSRRDHMKDILVTQSLLSMSREKKGVNNRNTLPGKLNVIVSHSNEYSKRVSFVEYENVNETEAHRHSHIDASVACVGSCGAPVLVIEKDWRLSGFEHTHSGHYGSDINYSGQGIGFTPFNHKHTEDKNDLDNKSYENKTTEECWIQESSKGHEVDLHEGVNCKKNPHHKDFLPVAEFRREVLPLEFRTSNVVDCIQAVIPLTVRVSVKYTSENRPETFPLSNQPYTGNKNKGTKRKRTGTGVVHNIQRYPNENSKGNETCPCETCLSSPDPKTQFAYVTVHSAAHVVYDDLEGKHTSCSISYI